ncbi:MAG: dienelactone hydrolase [Caulobacteraceae bacterium]|nr:dienelactone hydrolase [Caulobacteraceae bacterium]
MDTIADRWAMLAPGVKAYGPDDGVKRPAVLLYHGCGGLRPHLPLYADAAVKAGWRAFVVDSFAPRGWTREFGLAFVCTGVMLQGSQRAGDVLATAWGVSQRPDVDTASLALAGWSHGSWSIMDLMTMPLTNRGEAGLSDPDPAILAKLKGLFLAYPYGGYPALTRSHDWIRTPRTYAIIARGDHITAASQAARLYERARLSGAQVEVWTVDASHAFDEPTAAPPMRYDAALAADAADRFRRFLEGLNATRPAS